MLISIIFLFIQATFSSQLQWQFSADQERVLGCLDSTNQSVEIEQCIEELKVRYYFEYDEDSARVLGCKSVTEDGRIYVRETSMQNCLDYNATYFNFKIDQEKKEVVSCQQFSNFKDLYISDAPTEQCLKTSEILSLWDDKERSSCSQYNKNLVYIQRTSDSDCSDQYLIKHQSTRLLVNYFNGMERLSAKNIIEKVQKDKTILNPETLAYYKSIVSRYRSGTRSFTLEDFSRTFFKEDPEPSSANSNLYNCKDLSPVSQCAPDTFYSWGPIVKQQSAYSATKNKNASWNTELNPSRGKIFMTHTSIGSYCYGRQALRFKFKQEPSRGGLNDTVWTLTFSEWTTSKNEYDRIHSISFGTPEHFDEMVIEMKRRLDKRKHWWEAPLYLTYGYTMDNRKEHLLNGCVAEVYPEEEYVLVENLIVMLEAIINEEGWVHFNNCPSCKREDHFFTDKPNFFNPK